MIYPATLKRVISVFVSLLVLAATAGGAAAAETPKDAPANKKKVIGILAGMGPRSTSPFLEMVIDQCQLQYGAKNDIDFPHIIIYSLPTPFYVDRPIDDADMTMTIVKGLQKLEATGVDFIAMPCNSAHAYFGALKASIKIPLLNIVEETTKSLPAGKQRVTLLGTSGTLKSGLYQQGLTAAGHEFVFKPEWQDKVNALIKTIKTDKTAPRALEMWQQLLADIESESVESIVIACTDLNVVTGKVNTSINIIDSSENLAKATVKKYLGK